MPLDQVVSFPTQTASLLALNEALDELAHAVPEKSRIVEMHFFGGMTHEEIAAVLSVHPNTVARHLRVAQAWLQDRMTT